MSAARISPDFDVRRLTLALALEAWGNRGDAAPQPDARRAASYGAGLADAMIFELIAIRDQLLDEVQASDGGAGRPRDDMGASRPASLIPRGFARSGQ